MNENEKDQLWELLGKAKQPGISPFFARNVVRAVRQQQETRRAPLAWLRWAWRMTVAGAFALVAFGLFGPLHFKRSTTIDSQNLLAHQIVDSTDYDVITHLDELVASEENSIWLDDSVN